MTRTILAAVLFLLSLLIVLPVPTRQLWYAGIAVGEFSWLGVVLALAVLVWSLFAPWRKWIGIVLSALALALFATPLIRATSLGPEARAGIKAAFGPAVDSLPVHHRETPFSISRIFSGKDWRKVRFSTYTYATKDGEALTLNFYRPKDSVRIPHMKESLRPCLVVVHGGSWKSGSNKELPNVNRYFASQGYAVASINYRLAPKHHSPAPVEDVASALAWLRDRAEALGIQPDNFVLLGRSAGGQIVLASAYTLNDPGIRGVVSFYGPTDMIYGWHDPHNQLVIRHRDVLSDFFGGTPSQVRTKYIEGSPAMFVSPRTPPTLLVHGSLDAHVHVEESALLAEKLKAAGVPHYFLRIPWATHGCEYELRSPSGQLSVYAVERFLAAVTQAR